MVQLWLNKLLSTYTGGGVFFPVRYRVGTTVEDGVMLCVSTGGSTNVSKQNASPWFQIVHGGIPKPEYLFFEAYFYPRLVFMNICGFTDHQYGAHHVGTFENVLEELCGQALPHWRDVVFVRDQEFIYENLDRLLGMIGIPLWNRVMSGASYRAYGGLDVFMSFHSPGMPPGHRMQVQYLVTSHEDPTIRY